jgi:hypothetical protein
MASAVDGNPTSVHRRRASRQRKNLPFSPWLIAHRSFHAADRAAALKQRFLSQYSLEVRRLVNRDFQRFIPDSIETKQPFGLEVTVRNDISFQQSKMAKTRGFHVSMRRVALHTVEKRIERVKARGARRAFGSNGSGPHSQVFSNLIRRSCRPVRLRQGDGSQTPQRRSRSNQDSDGAEEDAHFLQRP